MKKAILILICFQGTRNIHSQPYIDLINCRYTASPGFFPASAKNMLNYASINTTVPFKFKNTDVLIFSPFAEKWAATVAPEHPTENYYGVALPVSYLKNFRGSNMSLVTTAILRMNDQNIDANGKLQIGGAALLFAKKNETFTWKFGLYVNGDLFGLFIIPLAGIDWKIDDKSNLFGVLPANLTYERKVNKRIYYGLNFRTFTNSYARDTGGYWRVDENQLGAFTDLYLTKNILFNLEAGSSILRKIRTGVNRKADDNWNIHDNIYFKISLAYRMRFR